MLDLQGSRKQARNSQKKMRIALNRVMAYCLSVSQSRAATKGSSSKVIDFITDFRASITLKNQ